MDQVRVRVYNKVYITKNKKHELCFAYDEKCDDLWTAAELLAEIQKVSAKTGIPISPHSIIELTYRDGCGKYPRLMAGYGLYIALFDKPDYRTYA